MKNCILIFLFICTMSLALHAQKKTATKPGAKPSGKSAPSSPALLKNMIDSASYAIGQSEAKFMKQQGITKINSAIVAKAIDDVMNNRQTLLDDGQANNAVMNCINKIQQEKSRDVIAVGQKFLEENKGRAGVKTTASGLQYEVIKEGNGARPTAEDTVTCNYAGTLINGSEFDNSYKRGEPISFPLRNVIPGWTEGLQHMTVGSKYKFFIPYQLGYGTQGSGQIPGGSTLIFEVELLDVKKKNP